MRKLVLLGSLAVTVAIWPAVAAAYTGPIQITGFDGGAFLQNGDPATGAGSHPYSASTTFTMAHAVNPLYGGQDLPRENLKDAISDLPPGLVGNPQAVAACTGEQFATGIALATGSPCPADSQVGVFHLVNFNNGVTNTGYAPLYNLVPPEGTAALLGFYVDLVPVTIAAKVRSDGDYGITAFSLNAQQSLQLRDVGVEVWGVPADPSHDAMRGACLSIEGPTGHLCPSADSANPKAFFTLPTSCVGPVETDLTVTGWAGGTDSASFLSHDNSKPPVPIGNENCAALEFSPTLEARPTTNVADSPSGLDVDLKVPQPAIEITSGQTRQCNIGNWSNEPNGFAIQWLRNGVPIPGATSSSYTSQPVDGGALLQCEVSATNAGTGSSRVASAPFPVHPFPTTPLPAPGKVTIEGTIPKKEGGTLTCKAGDWGGTPSFAYQWFKDGSPVSGQTQSAYLVGPEEAPQTVQCEVIGTNAAGTAVAFSSNVTSSPPPNPALPAVTDLPQVFLPESALPPATAHLKDTTITLPQGLTVNASGANGLDGCSSAQAGLITPIGQSPIHFKAEPSGCPDASKVGTVQVSTPILDHKVNGSVYLAKPYDNPFNSLLAIYIAVNDPQTGTAATIAGEVHADPSTGQLTTTVRENPQLPLEDIVVHIKGGPHASLKTPSTCGTFQTTSSLTPWSAPESGPPAAPTDSWQIAQAPGGGCPTSQAQQPNAPSFDAGTVSPIAGAYSPFVLHLRREDGSQNFAALTLTPPPGLVAKLAGTTYCPEAALAAAATKTGREEQSSPSCPASSHVGSVSAAAGAGPSPYHAPGEAYLAGPYKGAPLSLAIITPAVAGPFDLGNVVVRTALYIDPETTKITAVSDPLPQILQGIPLDIRSVDVSMDRPSFTLNPTSCDPMAVGGSLLSSAGQSAELSSRFQLAECTRLGFKPKLSLKLKGGTKRGSHPALTAKVSYPKGAYANIASASVALPHSEFLDQGHIGTVCTRVQFQADQCPAASIYGKVKATTPLLDKPLEGAVYLRSSSHVLPDLVFDLRGQIHVAIAGRVDSIHGGIRTSFESVPDAPVSSFTLQMQGGKKGLLVNSRDICASTNKAIARFTGHNGRVAAFEPELVAKCGGKGRKGHRHGHKRQHSR